MRRRCGACCGGSRSCWTSSRRPRRGLARTSASAPSTGGTAARFGAGTALRRLLAAGVGATSTRRSRVTRSAAMVAVARLARRRWRPARGAGDRDVAEELGPLAGGQPPRSARLRWLGRGARRRRAGCPGARPRRSRWTSSRPCEHGHARRAPRGGDQLGPERGRRATFCRPSSRACADRQRQRARA
jgi:hypothetical protein